MYKKRGVVSLLVSLVMLIMVVLAPGKAAALEYPIMISNLTIPDLTIPDLTVPDLTIPQDITVTKPTIKVPVTTPSVSIKAVPLYRCWNGKVHWYTTSLDERNSWLAGGFTDEGITCYISPVPLPGTVPLYKCMLYNDMYYATSSAERDAVISKYGFQYVGIEGYAIAANNTSDGDVNVNRWYHPESDHSDGWEWLAGDTFVAAGDMDRHHFYQVDPASIPGYNYEGVVFRGWSSAEILQKIKVTAPNGGESLKAGDVQAITWTSTRGGGQVSLCYATDGGDNWIIIKEGAPNNGSYSWTVPNKNGANTAIQVRWQYYDNETDSWAFASDTCDYRFSIAGSGVVLPGIEPNLNIAKVFPGAPSGLTVTPYLFSRLDLAWKDNASNETGFTIERKPAGGTYTTIATVGANKTKYSDTSAQSGVTYYYRVKANGVFDSGYSNEAPGLLQKIAVMPDINYLKLIPAAPTGLTALPVTGDPKAVKLSWQASSSDIDGYIVERKAGSGDWEMSSTVGANKTNVVENGLSAGQSYSYRVVAYNMFLNSKPSNTVVFNTNASSGGSVSPGGTGLGGIEMEFFIGNGVYNLNGAAKAMDVSPIVMGGRTLLPIRFVTDAIGADIQWFETEKKVQINQGATILELWIGQNQARINGQSVFIDPDNASVMPAIVNGRTMMPLRFIAENLGCTVEWIPEFSKVKIGYKGDKMDPQPEPPMQ